MKIFSLVMNRDGGDIDTFSMREYEQAVPEAERVAQQMLQAIAQEEKLALDALSYQRVGECWEIYQHDQGMVGYVKIHHTELR
jgi:hypothetical protein